VYGLHLVDEFYKLRIEAKLGGVRRRHRATRIGLIETGQ
jgi:hypothetical protein